MYECRHLSPMMGWLAGEQFSKFRNRMVLYMNYISVDNVKKCGMQKVS